MIKLGELISLSCILLLLEFRPYAPIVIGDSRRMDTKRSVRSWLAGSTGWWAIGDTYKVNHMSITCVGDAVITVKKLLPIDWSRMAYWLWVGCAAKKWTNIWMVCFKVYINTIYIVLLFICGDSHLSRWNWISPEYERNTICQRLAKTFSKNKPSLRTDASRRE